MRRVAYAIGAMVILGASAISLVPWRGGMADAFTVLAAAVQAAEQSHSIRIVRGPTDRVPPGTPLTLFMSGWGGPHTEERLIAVGPHSIRRMDIRDGSLAFYLVEDADTGEYSYYDQQKKTVYTADLRPLRPAATLVAADTSKEMWKSEQFEEQLAQLKQNVADKEMQQSVTDGVYHGVVPMQVFERGKPSRTRKYELYCKCQIVTISWAVAQAPKPITSRLEFYLNKNSKRPFAERQYLKIAGQRERLIGNITKSEYDVPFPPRARVPFPRGTKVVRGTARAVDIRNRFGHAVGFELLAGKRQVMVSTVHVPD